MSVPNAKILTPVRFEAASQVVRVTANSVTEDLTMTVVVGRDYWVSGDGQADGTGAVNGVGDLLSLFETCLETHSEITAASVALDAAYKVVATITASGSQVDIVWTHANTTLDPTVLGWEDSDVSDSSAPFSLTSPNIPRGIYLPEAPISVDSRDRQPVVGGIRRSVSGYPRVSRIATPLPEREIFFELVDQSKALDEYVDADDPYGSFEWNWVNSISLGRNFRLYENENDTDTFSTYRTRSLEDPLTRAQQFNVHWSFNLQAVLLDSTVLS